MVFLAEGMPPVGSINVLQDVGLILTHGLKSLSLKHTGQGWGRKLGR